MNTEFYTGLSSKSLSGQALTTEDCRKILISPEIELLSLINSAYQVRKKYWGNTVEVHIINNIQNGLCPEDCHYCAQAINSKAPIEDYPIKSDDEILKEAEQAYKSGAFRYCMVSSGRGPSEKRVNQLCELIKKIKSLYNLEVCVSAGLMGLDAAKKLKEAGLDRLNHNLNTSERNYPNICSTHTFQDRLNTLTSARSAGLEICSGMIAGMGESKEDIIQIALKLRELNTRSIPINFLVPIDGNILNQPQDLTPELCLRILCLFRFLNPSAEIRMAAGREGHLRSMEVLGLYAANSLFLEGYLNTKGSRSARTLRMIKDAGFTISSDHSLENLLAVLEKDEKPFVVDGTKDYLKSLNDLRPQLQTKEQI